MVAYDGDVGGTVLATIDNVMTDDVVTVSGMGGSPKDQRWETFAAGDCDGTSLGVSVFHISCSDKDMNGVEDCGKNQGNGKSDDPLLINDWLLDLDARLQAALYSYDDTLRLTMTSVASSWGCSACECCSV